MNFYRGRPFALIITAGVLIYGFGAFVGTAFRIALGILIILLSFAAIIFSRRSKDSRILGIPSMLFCAALSAVLLISLLMTHAYYDRHEAYYRTFDDDTKLHELSGEIISVESENSFSSVYKIKLTEIDGEAVSATGLVSTDTSVNMGLGSIISFKGEFCPLEDFYEYRDVSRINLLADGCVFACRMEDTAVYSGKGGGLTVFFTELRENIVAKINTYLHRDSSALASALLLGEKDNLGRIHRDFTYTGTLHILALSGMHIVIICGLLERFLLRLKLGAAARRILCCIFMILYAALTGFQTSVVRSVLMLIIANTMYAFRNGIDRVTSLFIACFLIISANPPAIYDVGLQLSFSATLGVLLVTDIPAHNPVSDDFDKHTERAPFLFHHRKFLADLLAPFGAAIFIIPLQCVYFGEMSLSAIPATLILTTIFSLLLSLLVPFTALLLLGLDFICKPFALIIDAVCHLTMKIAEFLAEFSKLISLRYPFAVVIIILFVIAIIVMMVKNVRGWGKAVAAYIMAVALIVTGSAIYENARRDIPSVNYTAVKSNDIFVLFSDCKAVIIDCTDGSSSAMYEAMEILADNYFTSVDTLIFTRLNSRHINAARALLERRKVASILIPTSDVDTLSYTADRLYEFAEKYGAKLYVYNRNKEIGLTYGSLTLSIPKAVKISRSTRVLPALKFTVGGDILAYIGRAAWEDEYIRDYISDSEHLIFGVNGPVFKGYDGSIDLDRAKFVFTADEELSEALSPYTDVTVDKGLDITFK